MFLIEILLTYFLYEWIGSSVTMFLNTVLGMPIPFMNLVSLLILFVAAISFCDLIRRLLYRA